MFSANSPLCELRCGNNEIWLIEIEKLEQETSSCASWPFIRFEGYIVNREYEPRAFTPGPGFLKYKKVIYHNPATIVLWEDGTKTVVKCDPKDTYDPEKGLALCFMKKALGNKSRAINDILHKEEIKK